MVPLVSMEDFKGRQPRPGSSLADIFCLVGCVARENFSNHLRQIRKKKKSSVKLRTLGVDEVDDHDEGFQFGITTQPNSSKGKELVSYIPYSVGTIRRERSSVRANYITSSDSGLTKRKRIDGGEYGKESSLKPKPNKMKIKEETRLGIKKPKEHIRAPSYSTNPNDLPEKLKRKIETAEGIGSYEKVKTKELDSSMCKELVVSPIYSVGTKRSSDSESHHEKSGVTKKKKKKKNKNKKKKKKKKSIDGGEDDNDSSLKPKPKDMKRSGVGRSHIRAPRYSTNPNDLPEELKRKIETLEGIESFEKAKMNLVIEKHLFLTDIRKGANRLSMPLKQIKPESFLDEAEIEYLAAENNWPVSVISPLLEEEDLTLKQWNMKKDNDSVSSSYVLKTRWNEVRKKNGLKINDLVQVWSFRDVGDNLYFALVLVEKATSDGSGSNGDGCSLPSTSPSTASDDHGGEKSGCDIAQGEETREQNENREIKDESSSGSRRSSTPSNNDHDGENRSSDIGEGKETREQDENRDDIRDESSSESERSSPSSCDNVSQDYEVVAPIC